MSDIVNDLKEYGQDFEVYTKRCGAEWTKKAAEEIEQLRKDKAKLDKALRLAKDMLVVNDLSFPHTLEVIDDALNNHGASRNDKQEGE